MSTGGAVHNGAGGGAGAGTSTVEEIASGSVRPSRETVVAAVDLLSHFWSRPVAAEVEIWSEAGDLTAELHRLLSSASVVEAVKAPRSLEEALELLDEYERLFVGPGQVPCPPYESFWREDVPVDIRRTLLGPCTAELKELYLELSLQVSSQSGELPDHVAIELEAIGYALAFEETGTVAKRLFDEHLSRFLPRLCRAVSHDAESPFYRDLAALTLNWLPAIKAFFAADSD